MNLLQTLVFGSISAESKTGEAVQSVVEAASDVVAQATEGAANGAGQAATGNPLMDMLVGIGLPLLMMGAIWFFMMRPQRKREKQMAEMQGAMSVGESVLTSAGLFGKIVSVGHDSFIIEFGADGGGRGVRVPVRKADVVAIQTPVMTPPPVETAETKKKK